MARPFWFHGMEATPTIASAVMNAYTTEHSAEQLDHYLQWVHAGRRDLLNFLLHWLSSESQEGREPQAMMQTLWMFLSCMWP